MKIRIGLIWIVGGLAFFMMALRAYNLQLIEDKKLVRLAKRQYTQRVVLYPHRGNIYDRHGVQLASSIEVDSLYADPGLIIDAPSVARTLASYLKISRKRLLQKLKHSRRRFVWIKRQLNMEQSQHIQALDIPGLGFIKESKRIYPNRDHAGQLLGFVGTDAKGLEGLERKYDNYLRGEERMVRLQRDALGRFLASNELSDDKRKMGADMYLTQDSVIQHIAERALKQGIEKYRAKRGFILVMDPQKSEILASAIYPSFNPNRFWKYKKSEWKNRTVTDMFEPGSTFKIFTIASSLERQLVHENENFYCHDGIYHVGEEKIRDINPYQDLSVADIVKFSSNIGASLIGERLGKHNLYQDLISFGFGRKTGIDLPGEANGIIRPPHLWSAIALRTISFGQGVSVSGLQLLTAFSAIVNGGKLMRPYVVKHIVRSQGELLFEQRPMLQREVITPRTSRSLVHMLERVVAPDGTGANAALPGYRVAGKTGTAQKPDLNAGGYHHDGLLSSFIGVAPLDDPKLAVLVMIDEPQGEVVYGGVVAAPIFREVIGRSLHYLGVPSRKQVIARQVSPDVTLPAQPKQRVVPSSSHAISFVGLTMREVLQKARTAGVQVQLKGNGRAVAQRMRNNAWLVTLRSQDGE